MSEILSRPGFKEEILSQSEKVYKLYLSSEVSKRDTDENRTKRKEEYGEVLTPFHLIFDMLKKLPEHVWRNKNFCWLDPVVGDGRFCLVLYFILMKTVSFGKKFTSDKEKQEHILKRMISLIDINPLNIEKTKRLFHLISPQIQLKILCYDFLKLHCENMNYFNTKVFDVILMNPPYNLGGTKSNGQKNVWVFFVQQALRFLEVSGYLVAIHPSSWRINDYRPRATKTDINAIYLSRKISHISMFTTIQTLDLMGVQIGVDYLVLQNTTLQISNKETHTEQQVQVEDIYGKTENTIIRSDTVIPHFGFSVINKLFNLAKKYGSLHDILYHTSEIHHDAWKKGKVKEGPHQIIHLLKKRDQKTVRMCNVKHTHQDTPKIIINGLGVKYVYLDEKGEYGVTDTPFIVLSTNANILNLLQSNLFNFITSAVGILGNNLNERVFLYIPNIEKMITKNGLKSASILAENEMYELLGFSELEKKEISGFTNRNVQNLRIGDRLFG